MMKNGALAVAIVQKQVMVVQAVRSHTQRDRWLDVYTYTPFGERVFLATDVPHARINKSDILTIFPSTDVFRVPTQGMLELPHQAFAEFVELTQRNQKRSDDLWKRWIAAH